MFENSEWKEVNKTNTKNILEHFSQNGFEQMLSNFRDYLVDHGESRDEAERTMKSLMKTVALRIRVAEAFSMRVSALIMLTLINNRVSADESARQIKEIMDFVKAADEGINAMAARWGYGK